MTIEERIKSLEFSMASARKSSYFWRRCAVAFAVITLMLLVSDPQRSFAPPAETTPPELRAKQFTLVDDSGKTRSILKSESGKTTFVLFDSAGVARAAFGAEDNQVVLTLSNNGDRPNIVMSTSTQTGAGLLLTNEKKGPACLLGCNGNGPYLHGFDSNGKQRSSMEMDNFAFLDEKGCKRLWFGANQDCEAVLLSDARGTPKLSLISSTDATSIMIADDKMKVRTVLGLTNEGPFLSLRDKNGNDRMRLGTGKSIGTQEKGNGHSETSIRLFDENGSHQELKR